VPVLHGQMKGAWWVIRGVSLEVRAIGAQYHNSIGVINNAGETEESE